MTDFYSQNRCVCSTRSHGPLLCAFCLSFHFKNYTNYESMYGILSCDIHKWRHLMFEIKLTFSRFYNTGRSTGISADGI